MMLGESLESLGLKDKVIPYHGAKEAVLPWARFPVKAECFMKIMCHKDVAKSKASFGTKLGHFMRRHGCRSIKVLPLAFYKAQEANFPTHPLLGRTRMS
ncbi:MAG: hypothetical protein IJ558_12885 [Treponema sp.]|nr:hypothetical protein [Treponema sp.]